MVRRTHEELKAIALSDPIVKQEYDDLEEEFQLLREMLHARTLAGQTQADVAKKLHTTTSAISRLENAGGKKRHSPTLETLRQYARALGCRLKVQLVQMEG